MNQAFDPAIPPGFHSNPSTWPERLPIIALALLGLVISTYLGMYQLGVVASVWDPFFGDGSRRVLHSSLSRSLPVPDAVLGACGYAAEAILGSIGGRRRWQTHPWITLAFGLLSGAMAAVGIALTICQPALARAWCTLCLCSAAISVSLAILARHEFFAAWHFWKSHRRPQVAADTQDHHWFHHRFFKGGQK